MFVAKLNFDLGFGIQQLYYVTYIIYIYYILIYFYLYSVLEFLTNSNFKFTKN